MIEYISQSPSSQVIKDILVAFTDPSHHHITSKISKETRPATRKVVLTKNDGAIQVYGSAKLYTGTKCTDFREFPNQQLGFICPCEDFAFDVYRGLRGASLEDF